MIQMIYKKPMPKKLHVNKFIKTKRYLKNIQLKNFVLAFTQ